MNLKRILPFLVLAMLACGAPPADPVGESAHAVYVINPMFTGSQNYFIGRNSSSGFSAVVVRQVSTQLCNWTYVSGSDGELDDTVRVQLSNNSDSFEVLTSPTDIVCSNGVGGTYTLNYGSVPLTSGSNLYVYGGSGDDWIGCSSTWNAAVFCYGNPGNDYMLNKVSYSQVYMDGGDGNDRLVSTAWNAKTNSFLSGSYGNDCLASSAAPAATYDCGPMLPGNIKSSTHVLGTHCTNIVFSCP